MAATPTTKPLLTAQIIKLAIGREDATRLTASSACDRYEAVGSPVAQPTAVVQFQLRSLPLDTDTACFSRYAVSRKSPSLTFSGRGRRGAVWRALLYWGRALEASVYHPAAHGLVRLGVPRWCAPS